MRIYCPTCRIDVAVSKHGKIAKHGNGNLQHAPAYGVIRPRPICYSSGMVVMKEADAYEKYKAQVTPRDVTAPDFTFSGWLRHNRIHAVD